MFDISDIHGNIYGKITNIMKYLELCADQFNIDIKVNRFYIDGIHLAINFSANNEMYLIRANDESLTDFTISKRGYKNNYQVMRPDQLITTELENFTKFFE